MPSSEQLEAFLQKLRDIDRDLAKLKDSEVRKAETLGEIKVVAKQWLMFSEGLRSVETILEKSLNHVDAQMKEMLQGADSRTRASTFRKKLKPALDSFMDGIIIPVIRHEGSPAQVASRQLLAQFETKVTTDELAYLEEAARCLASNCKRAAIILLWAAAIARFHSAIEKIGYNAYNNALQQTNAKKGSPYIKVSKSQVLSLPELQRTRDFDIIVVGMILWGYDLQVFDELDRLLGIRNNAAHPGMLQPTALDVQQYATKIEGCVFNIVPL